MGMEHGHGMGKPWAWGMESIMGMENTVGTGHGHSMGMDMVWGMDVPWAWGRDMDMAWA